MGSGAGDGVNSAKKNNPVVRYGGKSKRRMGLNDGLRNIHTYH